MSYLISIDPKNNQVLHNEVLKLVDSFSALSEKEMLAIVLAFDYNSIYKQFPDHERKRKAMWHAFDDVAPGFFEKTHIKNAIDDYMSLQYNPKIELARKYQQKIERLTEIMDTDDSATGIKKNLDAIAALRSSIQALEKEVDEQILNDGVIKGGMQLSFLEKAKSNRKLWLSITNKK
jgi:hypothetical protein